MIVGIILSKVIGFVNFWNSTEHALTLWSLVGYTIFHVGELNMLTHLHFTITVEFSRCTLHKILHDGPVLINVCGLKSSSVEELT